MTHQEVVDWVRENMLAKQREFGVPHWRIDIEYTENTKTLHPSSASIEHFDGYERATIRLNTLQMYGWDVEHLVETIEHELLHLMHAPIDIYAQTLGKLFDQNCSHVVASGMSQELLDDCQERMVRNMERLTFGVREKAEKDAKEKYEALHGVHLECPVDDIRPKYHYAMGVQDAQGRTYEVRVEAIGEFTEDEQLYMRRKIAKDITGFFKTECVAPYPLPGYETQGVTQ